jgi:hypothetical protein
MLSSYRGARRDPKKGIECLEYALDIKSQKNEETIKETMAILDFACDNCSFINDCDNYEMDLQRRVRILKVFYHY